jgi:hypothetical protein
MKIQSLPDKVKTQTNMGYELVMSKSLKLCFRI